MAQRRGIDRDKVLKRALDIGRFILDIMKMLLDHLD